MFSQTWPKIICVISTQLAAALFQTHSTFVYICFFDKAIFAVSFDLPYVYPFPHISVYQNTVYLLIFSSYATPS